MDEAYRLTFEVDRDGITLKSVRRLAMRVPPSQSLGELPANLLGRFVELRGEEGQPLYRRVITDLVSDMVEYPTGDPERPFGRVEAKRKRLVSVLVPVHERARSVAIVETIGPEPGEGPAAKRARIRELISVPLPKAETR